MTAAPRTDAGPRSLQDDLLDDLRRGPVGTSGAPLTAASVAWPPDAAEGASVVAAAPTPAVELRITPRSWSPLGWTRRSDGLTVNLGPLCLSLGHHRP